nr:T9SS type A sorting domain-containing protein [uncultured Brumimicrobium sp.]
MKKSILIIAAGLMASISIAQQQIQNGGFENWENVPGGSEPVNWNSFLTAGGGLVWAAQNQIEESTDVRPGSTGSKSIKIWSRSTLGIVANGNITLGKINMGSTSPNDPDNYNRSITADSDFSQELTDSPDSLVFWVKFIPNGHSGNARVKATIHDNYDYRDPEDAASSNHVVATAVLNYPSTGGNWVRKSIPFDYSGPATDGAYILITFTTSETAGGGKKDDVVFIDDVELIYNPLSTDNQETLSSISIYPNPVKDVLTIDNVEKNTQYSIHSVLGEVVLSGKLNETTNKIETSKIQNGVYILRMVNEGNTRTVRFVKN